MNEKSLAEQAAEKRREYKKYWNAKNRDKCREHTRRYWERKVLQEQQEQATQQGVNPHDGNNE